MANTGLVRAIEASKKAKQTAAKEQVIVPVPAVDSAAPIVAPNADNVVITAIGNIDNAQTSNQIVDLYQLFASLSPDQKVTLGAMILTEIARAKIEEKKEEAEEAKAEAEEAEKLRLAKEEEEKKVKAEAEEAEKVRLAKEEEEKKAKAEAEEAEKVRLAKEEEEKKAKAEAEEAEKLLAKVEEIKKELEATNKKDGTVDVSKIPAPVEAEVDFALQLADAQKVMENQKDAQQQQNVLDQAPATSTTVELEPIKEGELNDTTSTAPNNGCTIL